MISADQVDRISFGYCSARQLSVFTLEVPIASAVEFFFYHHFDSEQSFDISCDSSAGR